jgi:hypothetical protein
VVRIELGRSQVEVPGGGRRRKEEEGEEKNNKFDKI